MAEYFLPAHVHFCCRGDALVFLDLKQDDYTLINGPAAAALKALFPSATAQAPSSETHAGSSSPVLSDEQENALKELLAGGLLITDPSKGRSIRATQADVAMEQLLDPEAMPQMRLGVTHVWRFIAACTAAAARLRWSRIEDTVKAVEARKARYNPNGEFDIDAVRELTATFLSLRALFPRDHLCLYDSLSLLEFLARYRIFPTWVFGVRLEPWLAHCWVQQGQFIFNEDVETAAGFTPIMTI